MQKSRAGFTLIELLVVITIILIVSVIAIPTINYALSGRQVSQAALLLQAQIAGARDAAIRDNAPSGFRLLPDPQFPGMQPTFLPDGTPNPSPFAGRLDPSLPLAYNRMVPIQQSPDYQEGLINTWPGPGLPTTVGALPYPGPAAPAIPSPIYANTTALMAYESPGQLVNGFVVLNPPTSWFWNIRVGDKLQINGAGKWYTVVGPMSVTPANGNPEMFVNVGRPGTTSPLLDPTTGLSAEFLLLVNGVDDNQDGMIDIGWNGIDDDGINGIDDIGEWAFSYPIFQQGTGSNGQPAVIPHYPPPEVEKW